MEPDLGFEHGNIAEIMALPALLIRHALPRDVTGVTISYMIVHTAQIAGLRSRFMGPEPGRKTQDDDDARGIDDFLLHGSQRRP